MGGRFVQSSTAVIGQASVAVTQPQNRSSDHKGAIIGGVIGGITLLALLALLAYFLFRKKRSAPRKESDSQYSNAPYPPSPQQPPPQEKPDHQYANFSYQSPQSQPQPQSPQVAPLTLHNTGDHFIHVKIPSANFDKNVTANSKEQVNLTVGRIYNIEMRKGGNVQRTPYTLTSTSGNQTLEIERYFQ